MDLLVVSGVLCLGLLIGLLVGWYVNEAKSMTFPVLVGAVNILAGSGVLAIFHLISPAPTREYWLYPVGLLVGVLIAAPLDVLLNRLYPAHAKKRV